MSKIILSPKPHLPIIMLAIATNSIEFFPITSYEGIIGKAVSKVFPKRLPIILEVGDSVFIEGIDVYPTMVFKTSHEIVKYILLDDKCFVPIDQYFQPLTDQEFDDIIVNSLIKINTPSLN